MKRIPLIALLLLLAAPLQAEIIRMKDGSLIRGKIVNQTRTTITVQKEDGSTQKIEKGKVRRIQYFSPEEEKRREEEQRRKEAAEKARQEREAREREARAEEARKQEEQERKAKEKARKKEEKEKRKADKRAAREKRREERNQILSRRNALLVSLSTIRGNYDSNLSKTQSSILIISNVLGEKGGMAYPGPVTTESMKGSALEGRYIYRSFFGGIDLFKLTTKYEMYSATSRSETDTSNNFIQTNSIRYDHTNPLTMESRGLTFGWTPLIWKNFEASLYGGVRKFELDAPIQVVSRYDRYQNGTYQTPMLEFSMDEHFLGSPRGPLWGFLLEYVTPWRLSLSLQLEGYELKGDLAYQIERFTYVELSTQDSRYSRIRISAKTLLRGGRGELQLKYPLGYGFTAFMGFNHVSVVGKTYNIYLETLDASTRDGIRSSGDTPFQLFAIKQLLNGPLKGNFFVSENSNYVRLGVEKRIDFVGQ